MKPAEVSKQPGSAGLASELKQESDEIRQSAEALLESGGKSSKYREGLLRDIVKRTLHLDLIAQKMESHFHSLSTANELSASTVQLAGLVKDCVKKLGPSLEKFSSSVRVFIEPGIKVKMDSGILRSIVEELLANAIAHNSLSGWIKIEARQVMEEVVVTVKDCGAGIAQDDLPRLFDEKSGQDSSPSKKNFGLPQIKQVLESCGQKIWANSAVGFGTTFYFTLPAAH